MLAPVIESRPQESELFELMMDSKKEWDKFLEIGENFFLDLGLKKNSSLMLALNFDDIERIKFKKKFYDTLGYEAIFLDQKDTLKIEPGLNSNVVGSLYCKDQNQVDTILLKKFLIKKIKSLGGEIIKIKKLQKIKFSKGKLELNEKQIDARKIVIACGVWSRELLKKSFDVEVPLRPVKGVSMLFNLEKKIFFNNLWFRNIYVAQRKNNVLAVGATEDEKGYEDSITLDEIYFLSKSLWEFFPETEKLKVISINAGLRPAVSDGYPIIGNLNSISSDIICAFGHFRNGILLAPITAELVCGFALNRPIHRKYNFFSPSRFNL
jgi:glycine oxidase